MAFLISRNVWNRSAQDECGDSTEMFMIGRRGTNATAAWEMIGNVWNWSAQDECGDSTEMFMIGRRGTNATAAWEMIV